LNVVATEAATKTQPAAAESLGRLPGLLLVLTAVTGLVDAG
jgi:hypothetical protein